LILIEGLGHFFTLGGIGVVQGFIDPMLVCTVLVIAELRVYLYYLLYLVCLKDLQELILERVF